MGWKRGMGRDWGGRGGEVWKGRKGRKKGVHIKM